MGKWVVASLGATLYWSFRDLAGAPNGLGQYSEELAFRNNIQDTHHEVHSVSTKDQKYFKIDFGQQKAINPNIIPHPAFNDTWIIVAQLHKQTSVPNSVWFAELTCNAAFKNGVLTCLAPPAILPIAVTEGNKCKDGLVHFSYNVGPHDARVFHGPEAPYVVYGSVSGFTCFGQWITDFRIMVDWGLSIPGAFHHATEIQRPAPYGLVEKNYFLFWAKDGSTYAHFDVSPKRVFAKLELDGSTGADLAPGAVSDERCMSQFMPEVAQLPEKESTHQATNSLRVTLCNRADAACTPSDSNTFLFMMFQNKFYRSFHSVYEPYVMVFREQVPFQIHGISKKPIWIHGRGLPGQGHKPELLDSATWKHWDQTEMLYITSIGWKQQGMTYHGYLDDILLVGFGIEDRDTGGIDVLAGELLGNLGLCTT
ncbi:hypothetical protein BJ878DRAFT_484314 [Calycina marina]|uniref:Uncharacterized protein n=1 Tax=Calycina marina TaxID=1763456 RepID=A0A9P7YU80_9HELO|nr:hypothetical protein BJ878DRAFT_484314 [Calycina marina]